MLLSLQAYTDVSITGTANISFTPSDSPSDSSSGTSIDTTTVGDNNPQNSTLALSEINLDDWKADIRYSYITQNNTFNAIKLTATKKTVSTNLYLDSSINENTDIKGVFTLSKTSKNGNSVWEFFPNVNQKNIRQLYVTYKAKDDVNIKAGRLSSEIDKLKLVQNLDAKCDSSFGVICDGSDSIYISKEINEGTELEFLIDQKSYAHSNIDTYKASIKNTIENDNYYFRVYRSNYNNNSSFTFLDSDTSGLSIDGELAIDGSQTDKLNMSLSYSETGYDVDTSSINYDSILHFYTRINNRTSINLRSLMIMNDFRIIPSARYTKLSGDHITKNLATLTLDSTPSEMIQNGIGINIEYPMQKGRLGFSQFFDRVSNTTLSGDMIYDLKINTILASVLYDLNRDVSLKLDYEIFNVSGDDSSFNILGGTSEYKQDSKTISLETTYKF